MLQASEVPNLLEQLQECNVQLDVVEKGLNDLLDTKKMAFPRSVAQLCMCCLQSSPRVVAHYLSCLLFMI